MRADVPTIAPGERIEAAPTFRRFSNGANDPRGLVFNHTNWRFTPRSNGTGTKLSDANLFDHAGLFRAKYTYRPSQRHIRERCRPRCGAGGGGWSLSLAMLVKVPRRAQPWGVWWEVFAAR
jgi:hypothetical protein